MVVRYWVMTLVLGGFLAGCGGGCDDSEAGSAPASAVAGNVGGGPGGGGTGIGGFVPAFATLDTRVETRPAGSATSRWPAMAVAGNKVYVVWEDYRNPNVDIYFRASDDGGMTWRPSDLRVNTDPINVTHPNSIMPQIAASGSTVVVVWHKNNFQGTNQVFMNRSTDGGLTWAAQDVRLSNTPYTAGQYPRVACNGSYVHVVWEAYNFLGGQFIHSQRSVDGGATWAAGEIRVDRSPSLQCHKPQMATGGDNLYVIYEDWRHGKRHIYFNRSLDHGMNWLPNDRRVDIGKTVGSSDSMDPQIACVGSDVYAVWADKRSGQEDVLFSKSNDAGFTWLYNEIRLDTGGPAGLHRSIEPRIVAESGKINVVWMDNKLGVFDVYANRSINGGATWTSQAERVRHHAAGTVASDPRVAMSGSNVYVVWRDMRSGNGDIYMNWHDGSMWQTADHRVDRDAPGAAESSQVVIAALDPLKLLIAWTDRRHGSESIYSNHN